MFRFSVPVFWQKCVLVLLLAAFFAPAPSFAAAGREGILLVAFGTSVPEARPAMDAVSASFREAFPGSPVVWAYTSQIIRKKLAAEGRPVGGISEGLNRLAKDGAKTVRVQSLHMMAGEEFAALERAVLVYLQKHPGRFAAVYLGRPMLESRADAEELAGAIFAETAPLRADGAALVLMGHGQEHGRGDLVFEGVRSVLQSKDQNVFLATVEGARTLDELLAELAGAGAKKAVLAPLMLVAGDHARNDMAGDEEDSWTSRLTAAGLSVRSHLKGLGEMAGARAILVRHARESTDDLTREPRKP